MTEIKEITVSDAQSQFILYWGDMGSQWGVSRSVAQTHALLYLSATPLNAEEISKRLGITRSNVSNSLKELVSWKLIRRTPIPGDRREHFEAECDIWEIAMRIAQGRKEREIDPAMQVLSDCVATAKTEESPDPIALARMKDMQEFLNVVDNWYEQMLRVPKSNLKMLMKMGDRVISALSTTGKKSE